MGLAGPKSLPPEIVQRWNGIVHAFLADPASSHKLEEMAFRLWPSTPDEFGKQLRTEVEAYGKVVRENKIMAQ